MATTPCINCYNCDCNVNDTITLTLGTELHEKLNFQENLIVSFITEDSDELQPVGGLTIDIQKSDLDHFIVFASSQLSFEGRNGGSKITAWVDTNLQTIEEKRLEFVTAKSSLIEEKRLYTAVKKDGYYVRFSSKLDTTWGKNYYGFDKTEHLISEGANFIMLRFLALIQFTGQFETTALYINGDLCRNIYSSDGPEEGRVNNNEMRVIKIIRLVLEKCGIIHTSVTVLTLAGQIIKQEWEGCDYVLHVNPLYEISEEISPKSIDLPLRNKWETDMQLFSEFLDYKTSELFKNKSYIIDHPELRTMISDYVQAVLLKKPSEILEFTCDYFDQYAPQFIPYEEYLATNENCGSQQYGNQMADA